MNGAEVVKDHFFGPTTKERERIFKKCVSEAREIVKYKVTNESRAKVVELALKCCDRFHGGRATYGLFTLKKFADEIGIKKHTLYEWIRHKELAFDKLPPEKRKMDSNFYTELIKGISKDTPAKEVEAKYDKMVSRQDSDYRMAKYFKTLRSIHYNVSRPENLRGVEIENLKLSQVLAEQIASNIKRFLKAHGARK